MRMRWWGCGVSKRLLITYCGVNDPKPGPTYLLSRPFWFPGYKRMEGRLQFTVEQYLAYVKSLAGSPRLRPRPIPAR